MMYRFGPYTLDTDRFELRENTRSIPLQPQVFELLAYFVEHHDRVVTKQEVMDHLWPDGFVTDAALSTRVMEARKAIGDTGRDQRAIRTVHGRGFHFVMPVNSDEEPRDSPLVPRSVPVGPVSASASVPPIAGRSVELAELDRALAAAAAGRRQVVFITGEAGYGKTTLLSAFLDRHAHEDLWVGRGQCLDHRDSGEAHKPILDAIGQISRGANGQQAVDLLSRSAPNWLLKTPWLLTDDELRGLRERALGITHDRMLREAVELFEELARIRPVILMLEDLHWSDSATLDVLDWIAHRTEPARLLIIGTYRLAEVRAARHPLNQLQHDLRIRALCQLLALPLLSASAVAECLTHRFPGAVFPAEVADLLFRRTEGNPLFLSTIVNDWLARGWIRQTDDSWAIDPAILDLAGTIPDTLRQFVEVQLERLTEDDRTVIETAAVVGPVFTATEVAAGLTLDDEAVEEQCGRLARNGHLLREAGAVNWPDGTVASRFEFGHGLYQEIAYQLVQPSRRARLHRQIAARLERGLGRTAAEHAVVLASHFTRGRDAARAIHYIQIAADSAMMIGAHREATQHLVTGLDLLAGLADLPERETLEVNLRARLGLARVVTEGFGSPEAEQSLSYALTIASQRDQWPVAVNVGLGLAALLEYQSKYQEAASLLQSLPANAIEQAPPLQIVYHALHSCSAFHRGAFVESVEQGDRGIRIYDGTGSLADGRFAFLGEDPGLGCREWSALALWFLGFPDQARSRIEALVAQASTPGRRYSLASASSHAARLEQLVGDYRRARDVAGSTAQIATEHGFVYHAAVAQIVEGWAVAMLGDTERGLERARHGLNSHIQTGAMMDRPYFLALVAEILGQRGESRAALETIDEALGIVGGSQPFFYEAELRRLRGSILARLGEIDEAEQWYRQAMDVAEQQAARSLELRTATSLARHLAIGGKSTDALAILAPIVAWFSEGLATRDVQAARTLLAELRSPSPSPTPA